MADSEMGRRHLPRLLGGGLGLLASVILLGACGAAEEPGGVPADPGAPARAQEAAPAVRDITTYAGTGSPRFSGDGGPAVEAGFFAPRGVALDAAGNLLFTTDNRIRKIEAGTGVITTLVGTGRNKYAGDDGPAMEASLAEPTGIAIDGDGNIYIATHASARIRKVDAATGVITTIAGGAARGSLREESGDGGPATEANIREPTHVAVDGAGNVYALAENRVRKIDAANGIISTFAGTGKRGVAGDGGPAIEGELAEPAAIAIDSEGNVFIADRENHRVRKVDGATGIISTLAGIGTHMNCASYSYGGPCEQFRPENNTSNVKKAATGAGYSGDGGLATEAMLSLPSGVAIGPNGNVFIADGGVRVRKVDTSTGVITTVVAVEAETTAVSGQVLVRTGLLGEIVSIAVNREGDAFLADYKKNLVHKISAAAQ